MGNLIIVDDRYKYISSCSVAHILVEIDIQWGLFESIKLVVDDPSYSQILDYLSIPFICVFP
jgi:hypothetical protein